MAEIQRLRSFESIKVLADSRRLEILRLLMDAPATLTQLGRRMHQSPAWIAHHLRILERAGLVQLDEVRVTNRATEKYYGAVAGALFLEQIILPKTRRPMVVFSGSHDPALEVVAGHLAKELRFLTLYVGSLNGLANLRQGLCNLSGIHLLDETGEYNRPFVRHLFADRAVELVTLAYRSQGLILAPGNPRGIHKLRDLARPGVRMVNRNAGSGTRIWLDREFARSGIEPKSIDGYAHEVATHTEAARCIKIGRADAAVGLQTAAHSSGLDFIPLFEERYDLVVPHASQAALEPFLDYLQTAACRARIKAMTGYDTAHSGEEIPM